MWDGGEDIKPRYLGDDMVLLMSLTDTRAEEICKEEAKNRSSMFHSLEKWNLNLKPVFRLVWILY